MVKVVRASQADLEAAVDALRDGELVAFPTETVYGLGANASNPVAVRKVFELKDRPASHPVIVHIDQQKYLKRWVTELTPEAEKLADAFWPGPLTLVLPRAESVLDVVTGGQDSVAIRIPSHPMARQLLDAFGGGIAAPSANRFGRLSATRAEHVQDEFGDAVKVILDGGECQVGLESTIVSCLDGSVRLADSVPTAPSPRVPGSSAAHYSPGTPLTIVPGGELDALAESLSEGRAAHRRACAAPAAQDLSVCHLGQCRQAGRGLRPRSLCQPAHTGQGRAARASWCRKFPATSAGTRSGTVSHGPPRARPPTVVAMQHWVPAYCHEENGLDRSVRTGTGSAFWWHPSVRHC